jgi:mono/diheme cytochrome c family protein
MQAVKLSNGDIAYNTCNYPGPQDVKSPVGAPKEIGEETQADIDLAIDNIRRGIGMIVCVAMDYSAIPGINGGQPFTKFYTFGPTGNLLLSVSLDGRREKFMPGTCTTCHGGDAYGGQFPEDGSGRPDLKSRWQPFDMANLKVRFNSTQDLAAANAAVKVLNQRMVEPGLESLTTPRTKDLIAKWYTNDRLDQDPTVIPVGSPTQDLNLYRKVIQPGCQTCHAAQKVNENIVDTIKVCGGSKVLEQNHKMTNSLVPFERFWLDSTLPPQLGCGTTPTKHLPL